VTLLPFHDFHDPGPRTAAWIAWRPYGREAETAAHEAGHCCVAYSLGIRFGSVSIIPDADSRGRVIAASPVFVADLPVEEQVRVRARKYRGMTGARMTDYIMLNVAGAVATQLLFEQVPWSQAFGGADEQSALKYSRVLWSADEDIARAYVQFTAIRVRKVLGLMRNAVDTLARQLLEHRTLSRRRVGAILRAANVPKVPR
jgi:hypothetical protein